MLKMIKTGHGNKRCVVLACVSQTRATRPLLQKSRQNSSRSCLKRSSGVRVAGLNNTVTWATCRLNHHIHTMSTKAHVRVVEQQTEEQQLEARLLEIRAKNLQPLKTQVNTLWTQLQEAVAKVRKSEPKFPAPWQAWLTKERAETAIKRFLTEKPDQTEGTIVEALKGSHMPAKVKDSLKKRAGGIRPWFVFNPTTTTYAVKG